MEPQKLFNDRHYSMQAIIGIITANYIVFSLAVEVCVTCNRVHWFFWIMLAGLALYNFYAIRRNPDEFAESRTKTIYFISIAGLAVIYYLLAYAAQHCGVTVPAK